MAASLPLPRRCKSRRRVALAPGFARIGAIVGNIDRRCSDEVLSAGLLNLAHHFARRTHDDAVVRKITLFSVIGALAPIRQLRPIRAPFRIVAHIPISVFEPMVQPCTMARCPMVQSSPTVSGYPGVDMKHAIILHIAALPDLDQLIITF